MIPSQKRVLRAGKRIIYVNEQGNSEFCLQNPGLRIHDSTKFLDWTQGKIGLFPSLKPSTQTISIRLPKSLLEALKVLANKRDVPYQSLLKVFLAERLNDEIAGTR